MTVDITGKTSVLQMRNIYSTDGYWPPEASKDGVRLSQSADIYSAGCLLLRCVVSKAKRATYGRSPIAGTSALDEVVASSITDLRRICGFLAYLKATQTSNQ